jgi:arylsulfatase A-like enzyme
MKNLINTAIISISSVGMTYSLNSATIDNNKPNIIFILADDLGYGDLSCYGQKNFTTPNIDKIAENGIKFTDFYAGSTVCAPSRCSLLTGQHTGHTQIRGNKKAHDIEGQYPLQKGTILLPNLLKNAGYVTGAFGKWGLGGPNTESAPYKFFDEFFGYNCQGLAHNYYPDHLWHNDKRIPLDKKTYSHFLILDKAKKFITKNKDKSFFCYLPFTLPHAAMQVPEPYKSKYQKLFDEYNNTVGRYGKSIVKNPVAAYPAMVECLDDSVGEIVKLLKKLNIYKNTLIIFTSDNGPHREGGNRPKLWNSSGSFKGIKRDLYEGGIRVPFVAQWPANIAPNTITDFPAAFWDILPTFCQIAGAKPPSKIDGISILSTLLGKRQKMHDYLYWEFPACGGRQAIRKGEYKLIILNVRNNKPEKIELYNLKKDPSEQYNLAREYPEKVKEMKNIINSVRTESAIFPLLKK